VSGGTIQVTQQKKGTAATVDFTTSTKVSEVTSAGLTDVTAGSCVTVRPTRDNAPNGGTITAASVRVSPADNGSCPQPAQPQPNSGVQGTVASVAGNTITINTTSTPQTVTVSDKTKYTKEAAANSQAIAQGKCLQAQGTDNNGALQATTIRVQQAADGKCPGGGGPHRH
jgi:hypothetical protein